MVLKNIVYRDCHILYLLFLYLQRLEIKLRTTARSDSGTVKEVVVINFHTYNSKRRLVQILSTVLTIILPFFNILRLDIPTLRFYFFNSVLWVDEFYLLFLVVMLVLFIVIIFSMMYGRIWCGWMCPQTVLSELVHWFEKKTKRWFKVPKTGGTMIRRVAAYMTLSLGVTAISFLISLNLTAYFIDPYVLISDLLHGSLGIVTAGILIGLTALMFVDILVWREKFCTNACPYGMMQMVFTDSKTQVVRYQTERSEECIECKACVRDCMMGIDIRKSAYQTECIHCGVCVDSCETILGRLKTPLPTLISFSWGEKNKQDTWYEKLGFVDAKRWIIVGVVVVYTVVLFSVIHFRQPLSLTASGDRSTLYRKAENGKIMNDYIVKISNRSMDDGVFKLGCGDVKLTHDNCILQLDENPIQLHSREVKTFKLTIATDGTDFHPGPNRLFLEAVNLNNNEIKTQAEIVFFMPEPEVKTVN